MSFELIMLLGFFGAGLLGLLPENPEQPAEDDLRNHQPGQRRDTSTRQMLTRHGRKVPVGSRNSNVTQLRSGSRAVV